MPESAQNVIHELTNAGLLASDEITKYDEVVQVGVEALLERLIEEERITRYQAQKFLNGQSSEIYFGDYVVMEELGRGGMGTVLLARHRRMEREVAIKVLPVTALDSKDAVARFYQEVKVAAQLTHPNIVHAYDAGEHHGFHYLVMEYVRGHDLSHVLEQLGPIPAHLALDYLLQAAKGLEYAHAKGVVHRDIKPSNLLLDDEGNVKILDMGLARLGTGIGDHEASRNLTTTGQVMGTVEYMSPEQAEDTRNADSRSDIYSLGCTLYRLVTGQAPFSRDTVVKTILAHREAPIPRMASLNVPGLVAIDGLFESMVAKDPERRFQTVTQLVQEIKRLTDTVDFEKSCEVVELDVEIVKRGSSPLELPTMYKPSDSDSGIAYKTPVISSHHSSGPGSDHSAAVGAAATDRMPETVTSLHGSATPLKAPRSSNLFGTVKSKLWNKLNRGLAILVMGVVSLALSPVCFGLPLGVVTWLLANRNLKQIANGSRDNVDEKKIQLGRKLAIVATVIGAIVMLSTMIFD